METFKVVINTCYGGFQLSERAENLWRKAKNIPDAEGVYTWDIARDDADLVRIVEELGDAAGCSPYSQLKVVEVPLWAQEKGWHINEYDGSEHVAENHKTWH